MEGMDTIFTSLEEAIRTQFIENLEFTNFSEKIEGLDPRSSIELSNFPKKPSGLEEASRVGDVDSLRRLLLEDPFLLERETGRTSVGDNPLHVATLLGHADFVGHIISLKPELAKELNGQGLSPLHLAAAQGHLPVVKELLKVFSF